MRLAAAIILGLVFLALFWKVLSWAIGLTFGLLHLVVLAAVAIFIIGLVRRLIRL